MNDTFSFKNNEFLRETLFAQKMDRFSYSHSCSDDPLIESSAIFPGYPFWFDQLAFYRVMVSVHAILQRNRHRV